MGSLVRNLVDPALLFFVYLLLTVSIFLFYSHPLLGEAGVTTTIRGLEASFGATDESEVSANAFPNWVELVAIMN